MRSRPPTGHRATFNRRFTSALEHADSQRAPGWSFLPVCLMDDRPEVLPWLGAREGECQFRSLAKYVRFVVYKRDEDSLEPQGIFQAAADLAASNQLASHEREIYEETRAWFRERLKKPKRFARSQQANAHAFAICWFKDTAHEHLAQVRQFVYLLEEHGIAVRQLTTARPGYVVYEDDFQIAAEPFRGER